MDLDEARERLRNIADLPVDVFASHDVAAARLVTARLDTLDRRAAQVRGGLKPYASPVEIVDFLLAEAQ